MYTTYSVLGELAGSSFAFDSDTRLQADPTRLARARTIYLPRADIVDRPMADALVAWVRAGGTLVVTDPHAFTWTPRGEPMADVRAALIGSDIAPATGPVTVAAGALGPSGPAAPTTVAMSPGGKFASPPADATVIGVTRHGEPSIITRSVGSGRVVAFAGQVMYPKTLDGPGGLVDLVAGIQRMQGAPLGLPVWRWELPGTSRPGRLPWKTAITPPTITS